MDANTIREKINNKDYEAKVLLYKTVPKFKENHTFDEDASVKWNKAEVERRNAEIDAQMKDYRLANAKAANDFTEDVIAYLMENYSINADRAIAEKIYYKAYEDGHSSGYSEVLNEAIDIVEFVEDILKSYKEGL